MLDLEVVPERSLGNEQWEFILGESARHGCPSPAVVQGIRDKIIFGHLSRNAYCPVCAGSQTTMSCHKICSSDVQRGCKCS